MNKMVVANLVHRPVRSLISIVAISVEVTLILVVVGLLLGILEDVKQRQAGIGADIIVQPSGASFLVGVSGAPVSVKVADVLRKVDHISAVAPVIIQFNANAVETIFGVDLDTFQSIGGPLHYLAGGPFQGPDDVLIDDIFANSNHLKVGDSLEKLNHTFRVAGIVEHGKGARIYLPLKTLQEMMGAPGKASVFYVKLDKNTPETVRVVVDSIKKISGMEQYQVRSMKEWMSLMTSENLPGFATTVDVVIAVAMIIGFIVIFQAMYTAIMERTREIGILKSLGATKLYIINLVMRETALLAVIGTLLGFAISYAAQAFIHHRFPLLRVMIGSNWLGYSAAIAIVGAILGAIYPAYKAAQKDPIDALAYE
jgi:putative ABC transport system permease protein